MFDLSCTCCCSAGNQELNDPCKPSNWWFPVFGNPQTVHSISLPHRSRKLRTRGPRLANCELLPRLTLLQLGFLQALPQIPGIRKLRTGHCVLWQVRREQSQLCRHREYTHTHEFQLIRQGPDLFRCLSFLSALSYPFSCYVKLVYLLVLKYAQKGQIKLGN